MGATHRYTSPASSNGTQSTRRRTGCSGPAHPDHLVAKAELDWISEHHTAALKMARRAAGGRLGGLTAEEVVAAAYDTLLRRQTPWKSPDPEANVRRQIRWTFKTLICDLRSRPQAPEPGVAETGRGTRQQDRASDDLADPAASACWGGLEDLYVELNAQLAHARTRSEIDAIATALALLTLSLDPTLVPTDSHRGRTGAEHLVAHAVAVARPWLEPSRELTPARRKERQRLADIARRHLIELGQFATPLQEQEAA